MKNFLKVIFALIFFVAVFELFMMNQEKSAQSTKHRVITSTFALYDITKNIVGDTFEVIHILPFGVSAHSFEPTPKLMAAIERSDLVIYSGAGLEPWTDGFAFNTKVINMSEHVHLKEMLSKKGHEEERDEHKEHHHHERYDPHYWLDVENMILATKRVAKELIELSPKNSALYTANMNSYISRLQALDNEYKSALSSCKKDMLITNHRAFGYLTTKYGLHTESLSGMSPETEPSAKSIKRIMRLTQEHNISTIFFENFVSDRTIKSIARDTGIQADVLQPLGNITADEAKAKLSYEDIMRKNLYKITKALECR